MGAIRTDKIVIFGAGRIGRSFIGQLFSRGGYQVVFVDVSESIISELNRRRSYPVIIKSETEEKITIENARGILASDIKGITDEIATAGIAAVSVGQHGLSGLFPALADGLMKRYASDPHAALDIIIAENLRDADEYFRGALTGLLPDGYPLTELVGLVETSIGKMVPIMLQKDIDEDILQVFAEPYNTLILDKKAFRNPIPQIGGLSPKENMKAWVDRKLFIHNLGHATAAYLGYQYDAGFTFLYEALAVKEVHARVRDTMLQSAGMLMRKYPDEFSIRDLTEHIDDLLSRFQNKALGDTIFRVGCDLPRKLGPDDRLAGAIRAAVSLNQPYDLMLWSLVCGCHFRAADEHGKMLPQDVDFARRFSTGIGEIMGTICGFDPVADSRIIREATVMERKLAAG